MDILLLQTDPVWLSPEENYARLDKALEGMAETDLIVLPEMFATGFVIHPRELVKVSGMQALEWMKLTAARRNAAVAGSVAVGESGKFFNRCYFVRPDGSFDFYDKRHLFGFGGENEDYSAGKERLIVRWRGVRILLQVCYDLRFPVFGRNRDDYDMALYVANWPQPRRQIWDVLLRARAIENVCYVAGVNRVGNDPECIYDGGTALLDFRGNPVATAKNGTVEAVSAKIDMAALRDFRRTFPALKDADSFELNY